MVTLSVVVPLYNEEDNILPLIESLELALTGIDFEAVFVDDGSRDNTVSTTCWCNATWAYAPHVYFGIYA